MEISNSNTYYTPVELRFQEWSALPATDTRPARKAGSSWLFTTPGGSEQPVTVFGVKQSFSGNAKIEKGGLQVTKSSRNRFSHWLSPTPSAEEVEQMMLQGANDCYAKLTGKLDNPTVEIITKEQFAQVVNPQMLYPEDSVDTSTQSVQQAQQL